MTTLREVIRATKRRAEPVDVPDWGKLYVRRISASERLQWEEEEDKARSMALLVRFAASDEEGNALFTDEDVEWLTDEADSVALFTIYRKALEHNALTTAAVEAIRKNLEAAALPAAALPTNLPGALAAST